MPPKRQSQKGGPGAPPSPADVRATRPSGRSPLGRSSRRSAASRSSGGARSVVLAPTPTPSGAPSSADTSRVLSWESYVDGGSPNRPSAALAAAAAAAASVSPPQLGFLGRVAHYVNPFAMPPSAAAGRRSASLEAASPAAPRSGSRLSGLNPFAMPAAADAADRRLASASASLPQRSPRGGPPPAVSATPAARGRLGSAAWLAVAATPGSAGPANAAPPPTPCDGPPRPRSLSLLQRLRRSFSPVAEVSDDDLPLPAHRALSPPAGEAAGAAAAGAGASPVPRPPGPLRRAAATRSSQRVVSAAKRSRPPAATAAASLPKEAAAVRRALSGGGAVTVAKLRVALRALGEEAPAATRKDRLLELFHAMTDGTYPTEK